MTVQYELRFLPKAWTKLLCFRDEGSTEIGCFGISDLKDPLLVRDIALLEQTASPGSTLLSDEAIAAHYDTCYKRGLQPCQFARIWIHTHPSGMARPTAADYNTFMTVFADADWSVMAIVTVDGRCYAELQVKLSQLHACTELPVTVDWSKSNAKARKAWKAEYATKVQQVKGVSVFAQPYNFGQSEADRLLMHEGWDDTIYEELDRTGDFQL